MKKRAGALGLERVRINAAGCLDRCEFGPVIVIYPQGIWYRVRNEEEADEVLQLHLVEHGRATALMLV